MQHKRRSSMSARGSAGYAIRRPLERGLSGRDPPGTQDCPPRAVARTVASAWRSQRRRATRNCPYERASSSAEAGIRSPTTPAASDSGSALGGRDEREGDGRDAFLLYRDSEVEPSRRSQITHRIAHPGGLHADGEATEGELSWRIMKRI